MGRFTFGTVRHMRALVVASIVGTTAPVSAAELRFVVHPILPEAQTVKLFSPLVEYLEQATGHSIKLVTSSNFLVHWQLLRREGYELILDGPHFTDYRVEKMGYTVLAKVPAVVSYTLVANTETLVLEPDDLVGKRVGTTPSPALGALRLNQLFPNPARQPHIVEAGDSVSAAERVVAGETAAAIIPSPLVGRFSQLSTVATTEQVPAPAISASPAVPEPVREAIRRALLDAGKTEAGQRALKQVNIEAFEPADNTRYAGQAKLLEGVWGY